MLMIKQLARWHFRPRIQMTTMVQAQNRKHLIMLGVAMCVTLIRVTGARARILSETPFPLQEQPVLSCQLCFLLLSLGTVQLPLLLHHLGPVLRKPGCSFVLGLCRCRPFALLAGLPLCLLLLACLLSQLPESGCICTTAQVQYIPQ